jgi:hypothetical protein
MAAVAHSAYHHQSATAGVHEKEFAAQQENRWASVPVPLERIAAARSAFDERDFGKFAQTLRGQGAQRRQRRKLLRGRALRLRA